MWAEGKKQNKTQWCWSQLLIQWQQGERVPGVAETEVALHGRRLWLRRARSEKKHGGIMEACILCDKLPAVCMLPDSGRSKETRHLNPLTYTKVRSASDFCYQTGSSVTAKLSYLNKARLNSFFQCLRFKSPHQQQMKMWSSKRIRGQKYGKNRISVKMCQQSVLTVDP